MNTQQAKKQEYKNILAKYIPENSVNFITKVIFEHNIKLIIAKPRNSKYGDYKPPQRGNGHIISINYNLNQYSFLLTFLHELAHLIAWNKFKNRITPHGSEWKQEFSVLLKNALQQNYFHSNLVNHIQKYSEKPSYSSSSHTGLMMALAQFDKQNDTSINENSQYIDKLQIGDLFIFRNNRKFIIEEKLRKRIRCKEIGSNKLYLFNPLAKVSIAIE